MGFRFANEPVIVLGFGAAAVSAIVEMRAAGYDGAIVVVTDGESKPYSPVLTSYYAGGRIEREACYAWADLDPASLVDEVVTYVAATSLDVSNHEVELADGRRFQYAKLLIATGSHPVAPGFPHVDGYEPLVLRTMRDADRLRNALVAENCRRVLVSGTSMVGLKVLEACLDCNKGVTLLGRSPHILRRSAHEAVAKRFESLLEKRGVKLRLSQEVKKATVDQSDTQGIRGCRVTFSNDEEERFDEVVLAQGVAPNLDFVEAGAFNSRQTLATKQGVVVDQFMRASVPDVYAAGDVAQGLDLLSGEKRVIALWQNAVQQGRCAGRAIADELAGREPKRAFPGSLPANVIHVRDILFASAGTIAEGSHRRIEVEESHDVVRVMMYERHSNGDYHNNGERLIGFNMLSVVSSDTQLNGLEREIGKYRREVVNSFL